MKKIKDSELILNKDGSIYHLHLSPDDLAKTVITVGDPDRVAMVSEKFDSIELKRAKREFVTHTGTYKGKRISVISTGIGTDNIDIVLNELDALVNIDLPNRTIKSNLTSLNIIRLGTSGCLDENIPVDSILLSTVGFGLDGLMNFYDYQQNKIEEQLTHHLINNNAEFSSALTVQPYFAQASKDLLTHFQSNGIFEGITATCTGFYGPQGRVLRLKPKLTSILDNLRDLHLAEYKVTNFEMETAGIYALSNLLGHKALSINLLIANRESGKFSVDANKSMHDMITWALDKISTLPE